MSTSTLQEVGKEIEVLQLIYSKSWEFGTILKHILMFLKRKCNL